MTRVRFTGGEKEGLHASLGRHRDACLRELEGLDDEAPWQPMARRGTRAAADQAIAEPGSESIEPRGSVPRCR